MKKIEINLIKSLIYGIIDRITGLPDYRITGLPDYRITGLPDYRITGLPADYRITGLPDYRITGLPDYRITGLPDYRITGLPAYAWRVGVTAMSAFAWLRRCLGPSSRPESLPSCHSPHPLSGGLRPCIADSPSRGE